MLSNGKWRFKLSCTVNKSKISFIHWIEYVNIDKNVYSLKTHNLCIQWSNDIQYFAAVINIKHSSSD